MLIKTNLPGARKNSISIEDGDKWLEENQHRKAENMTGQLAPDQTVSKIYGKSNAHLFITPPTPMPFGRPNHGPSYEVRPLRRKRKRVNQLTIQRQANFDNFITKLNAGEVVRLQDLKPLSVLTVSRMATRARKANMDVLTINDSAGKTVARVLNSTINADLKNA